MGTVIIFRGEAYLFLDKEPQEAVTRFLTDWFDDIVEGFQVFPIGGAEKPDGTMTSVTVQPDRWVTK